MPRHKVIAVQQDGPANPRDTPHIVAVGTAGVDGHVDRVWSAGDVVAAMEAGEAFFTRRPTTRHDGFVFPFHCKLCGRDALRSGPDTEDYNRLDQHPHIR